MIFEHILKHSISEKELYKAYRLFFNTFASEHRLKIINLLRKKSMNVSELQKKIGLEQSIISHNLSRLKECGFIISKIKGKYRYYNLNEKTIKPIMNLIDEHMKEHCLLIIKKMREGKR